MSNAGLSYGLNLSKKPNAKKPLPGKRKTIFDSDNDSDAEDPQGTSRDIEEIGEFGGLEKNPSNTKPPRGFTSTSKAKGPPKKQPPVSTITDLSSTFTSQKHAKDASSIDPNIYEFDSIYDTFKPAKKITQEDKDRKPKYMKNLLDAAAVRKRDATIAEEKKLAREREAEGDEFADKEKFVTGAYKRQQEENRRIEEEERKKEEQEAKKNKGAGMTNFYKNMLEMQEVKHQEAVKAVEERKKAGSLKDEDAREKGEEKKSEADIAKEINSKKADAIAINDEGQVVDKRQLLKGGLNIAPKPKTTSSGPSSRNTSTISDRSRGAGVGQGGGKQAMRERQSRMMEAQLEQATKRALEEEEEEAGKVERAAKSRKTEGEIVGAKERYLARKREAEEAKKRGEV